MGKQNDTHGELSAGELAEMRKNARPCTRCGMTATIDPVFHEERNGHSPAYADDQGVTWEWQGLGLQWAPVVTGITVPDGTAITDGHGERLTLEEAVRITGGHDPLRTYVNVTAEEEDGTVIPRTKARVLARKPEYGEDAQVSTPLTGERTTAVARRGLACYQLAIEIAETVNEAAALAARSGQ